jgi:hypothetical protein
MVTSTNATTTYTSQNKNVEQVGVSREFLAALPPRVIINTSEWVQAIERRVCTQQGCQGTLEVLEGQTRGEVVTLSTLCSECGHESKVSNIESGQQVRRAGTRGPLAHTFNLEGVAATILNGSTYTEYSRERQARGLPCLTQRAYRAVEKQVLEVAMQEAKSECRRGMQTYQKSPPETLKLDLGGDCGWSHRRNASQATYSVIDLQQQRVVYQAVLTKERKHLLAGKEVIVSPGNYFGTAKGMEGEGFRRVADDFEEEGVLPYIRTYTVDQDSSVIRILHSDCRFEHVAVQHDPGHLKNNVTKDLQRELGESKAVTGLADRVGHWIMTSIKESLAIPLKVFARTHAHARTPP